MTPAELLAAFETFADAPLGIQRLRELVLNLAVRGKLVQPKGAETGHEALMRITAVAADNDHPVDETPLAAEAQTLKRDTIPHHWAWGRIGHLCELKTGATPSRNNPGFFGGNIKWLVSGDIHQREIFDCAGRITKDAVASHNCKVLPADSVLMALNGQGKTRATVAILRTPAACNQSLVAMVPLSSADLLPEYLYWTLRERYSELRSITGAELRRGLNMRIIRGIPVPIPPPAEQRGIVAKVDELMALIDKLEAARNEREVTRVALRDSALAALGEAKNADEVRVAWARASNGVDQLLSKPADVVVLQRAITDLAVCGRLMQAENPCGKKVPDTDGQAGEPTLPPGWTWVCGSEIFPYITSGSRGWAQYYSDTGPIFLRIGNLDYDTVALDLRDTQCVRPPSGAEGLRTRVLPGDILVSITGDTGMVGMVPVGFPEAYINQHIALLRPSPLVFPEFMAWAMASPLAVRQLKGAQRGIKNSLGLDDMRRVRLPLPPRPVQEQIVTDLHAMISLCQQLSTELKGSMQAQQSFAAAASHHLAF